MPEAVLLTVAGLQVPTTALSEVVGNTGAVLPLQIGPNEANVGVINDVTVTSKVAVVAHWPAVGVNV